MLFTILLIIHLLAPLILIPLVLFNARIRELNSQAMDLEKEYKERLH